MAAVGCLQVETDQITFTSADAVQERNNEFHLLGQLLCPTRELTKAMEQWKTSRTC